MAGAAAGSDVEFPGIPGIVRPLGVLWQLAIWDASEHRATGPIGPGAGPATESGYVPLYTHDFLLVFAMRDVSI